MELNKAINNVIDGERRMTVDVGANGIVEFIIPICGDRVKAEASACDTTDGSTCAVVVKTDRNTFTDALFEIVAAEHEGEYDRAHIVDGMYGVHFVKLFIDERTSLEVICYLCFAGECPFECVIEFRILRDLFHTFTNGIKRCFCCESSSDGSGAEHFTVDTVFAVGEICVVERHLAAASGSPAAT